MAVQAEEKNVTTWAMLCHLSALSTYIGVPFGHIILPLIIWLIKKDASPFIDEQGKESLNFQISMTIYGIIAGILCFFYRYYFNSNYNRRRSYIDYNSFCKNGQRRSLLLSFYSQIYKIICIYDCSLRSVCRGILILSF